MELLKCEVLSDLIEGFPFGYMVLIRGDLGMGKTLLVKLLAKSVLNNYPLLYVTFDDNPESVVDDFKNFSDRLFIIDGFTISDQRKVKSPNVIDFITEFDPGQVINKVGQAVYSKGVRGLIIDSINDLLVNVDPRGLIAMLKQLKALSRSRNLVSFIVAHVTTEDVDNLLNTVEYVFDGVIEMEFDENMANIGIPVRRLRIKRMKGISHSMNWFYFTTAKGTIVPIDINEIKNMLKNTLESLGVQIQGG
ncbi:AAA family ATPase [Vulcanisaeta sp. EB80]|uniref:RAD55 family ATPase n=1 Tax=Vulcanisaeta sp. EB80 TaxID=1650660 RepID=UPI0009BE54D0|nr:RAD55 family ATPase [Vulcanisaeta sp. EB80]PLC67478.1 AAA family ATPase [Vulcanisaeta sp. EB80]